MSQYKPYPVYKDSGVDWLGRVPEHWEVMAIKHIVSTPITDGPHETPEFLDDGIPFVSAEAVSAGKVDFEKIRGFISREDHERYSQKYCPRRGDIFMIKSGATTGVTAIVDTDEEFNIWSPLAVIRCGERSVPYFVLNFMRSRSFQEAVALSWSYGTQQNIGMGVIGNLAMTVPPQEEQRAIAGHLDRETARIDALIEKKTRFIELLREKRHALITHAVTKGLDPNVKMKDSGVEWLGEVPEHWVTRRVAALFREVIRPGVQDLPVLSISIHSGISDDELSADERDRKVSLIEDREKYKRVRPGDLAYNMMRAWQGAFGAVTVDGLVSPAYVVAEPKIEISTAYIELLLRTPMAIEEMRKCSRGITDFRMRMYWEAFREVLLLLPPYEEQIAIVNMVMQEAERIDALAGKTEHSIALLKERRSALVTAAVTGQIDLREAV